MNDDVEGAKIPVNPLLAKIAEKHDIGSSVSLKGFVGPAASQERVLLYPRLDDLSESWEFNEADVLGFEDDPESKGGGKIVWVKMNAVIFHRTAQSAENLIETRRGRLRIRVRMPARMGEACSTNCKSTSPCGGDPCSSEPQFNRGRRSRVRLRK